MRIVASLQDRVEQQSSQLRFTLPGQFAPAAKLARLADANIHAREGDECVVIAEPGAPVGRHHRQGGEGSDAWNPLATTHWCCPAQRLGSGQQRFGSALNAHTHLQCGVTDSVFSLETDRTLRRYPSEDLSEAAASAVQRLAALIPPTAPPSVSPFRGVRPACELARPRPAPNGDWIGRPARVRSVPSSRRRQGRRQAVGAASQCDVSVPTGLHG